MQKKLRMKVFEAAPPPFYIMVSSLILQMEDFLLPNLSDIRDIYIYIFPVTSLFL